MAIREIKSKNFLWDLQRFGVTPSKLKARLLNKSAPRIFCTAMPKAGTHLLERLLCLHPRLYRARVPTLRLCTMKKHSPIEVVDNLKSGQIILSHLEYDEKLNNAIEMHQVKHLLIMRDPRDAIISNYFFIRKNKNHHAHEALSESQSVQHAINRLIRGVHPDSPPMNMVIQGYQDWLQHAKLIYFEDLIGSAKKMQSRRDTAQRIFRFLEVPVDGHCLDSIMENLISPDSPTYRKGVMGEWSQFFSEDNKQVFKEVAGEELIELGYEKDLDW